MNPDASNIVALKSRDQALDYLRCGNFGRAFAHFLVALQLKPEWKADLKKEFSLTLCTWGEQLESAQRFDDLFNCYEQAIEMFPENEYVLCNLGSHLFRLEHLREAAHYFRQALNINEDYLPAYRNLQNVCNALVERWHFRMLNDSHRNEAYREAILKKVQQGFTSVLDIGTGTGILSLYAVKAGATEIHACDYSPTMCSIARDVLKANKMADNVTVINKLSNNLSVPHDFPQRKSLVVTETMDAGLLGEDLLQTLLHAWDNLLQPPCPGLMEELGSGRRFIDCGVVIPFGAKLWAVPVQSYNISRRNYVQDTSSSYWDFSNILLYSDSNEPYDTEDLKGCDKCKFLGDAVELFHFNFNNYKQLREFYEGKFDGKSVSFEFEGKADALAVWFDVLLDEDITISSSPFKDDVSCWDQAVFPFREPKEALQVNVSCGGGRLKFDFELNSPAKENKRSEFAVSSDVILFLNNKILQDAIIVLPELYEKVLNVLDLSPFPTLGLRLVREKCSNLFCVLKSQDEIKAVVEFVRNNNLDLSKVRCFLVDEMDEILSDKCFKFDYIFNNLFETSGELKENNINVIPRLIEQLSPGGVLAPTTIKVMTRLVDCPWISTTTRVTNSELVEQFNIAPFINVYQVFQQLDIDLLSVECDHLSEPVVCLELTQGDMAADECRTETVSVSVMKDGCINALPVWYQYQLTQELSTLQEDSHVNQAVFVVDPPCPVKAGDTAVISVTFLAGILRIKLVH